VLAWGILVAGISLAWLIGRRGPEGESRPADPADQVLLRRRVDSHALARDAADPGMLGCPAPRRNGPLAAALPGARDTPLDKPDPLPPNLAKSFPPIDSRGATQPVESPDPGLAGSRGSSVGMSAHRIVNGDSLPALAARYLGSADRAEEIFDANRDRLSSADALPIGLELRIPPREATPHRPAAARQPELVPIRPRGARAPAPDGKSRVHPSSSDAPKVSR